MLQKQYQINCGPFCQNVVVLLSSISRQRLLVAQELFITYRIMSQIAAVARSDQFPALVPTSSKDKGVQRFTFKFARFNFCFGRFPLPYFPLRGIEFCAWRGYRASHYRKVPLRIHYLYQQLQKRACGDGLTWRGSSFTRKPCTDSQRFQSFTCGLGGWSRKTRVKLQMPQATKGVSSPFIVASNTTWSIICLAGLWSRSTNIVWLTTVNHMFHLLSMSRCSLQKCIYFMCLVSRMRIYLAI